MSFSTSAIQLGGTLQLQERMSTKRSERDHQRYMEKRDEILAYQKVYRETNKEEIKSRRRERNFQKVYVENKRENKSRRETNRAYYMKNREKLLAKARQYYYEHKRKQNTTAGSERCAADCT